MMANCTGDGLATYWAPILFQFEVSGWLLLALYFATIGAAGLRLRQEAMKASLNQGTLAFWAVIVIVLVMLSVNRLFNLQALVTIAARCAAESEGWYSERRPFQLLLVGLAAAAGLAGFVFAFLRRETADERLVVGGMAALIAFVAARSVSFHGVDAYLGTKISGLSFNGLTEGAALGLVLLGALSRPSALLIPPAPRATPRPSGNCSDRDP
jgi:hypothetical protein